eukprot:3934778-Rhodomonas_salina.1
MHAASGFGSAWCARTGCTVNACVLRPCCQICGDDLGGIPLPGEHQGSSSSEEDAPPLLYYMPPPRPTVVAPPHYPLPNAFHDAHKYVCDNCRLRCDLDVTAGTPHLRGGEDDIAQLLAQLQVRREPWRL